MEKFKVFIDREYMSGVTNIWVTEFDGSKHYNLTNSDEGMVRQEVEQYAAIDRNSVKPILSIPFIIADAFLKAIHDDLSNRGVKTIDENRIEGELIAKREHLDDMRMIVKKVLKID